MSRDNFVGGTNWVVIDPYGGWSHRHLDGEDPATVLAGLEFHAVKRPPDDFETWDGKDGWKLDPAPMKANRRAAARKVRDKHRREPIETTLGLIDEDGRELIDVLVRLSAADSKAKQEMRFADGTFKSLTPAELRELQEEKDRRLVAIDAANWAIEKKINAASTRPAIAAVDIEAGYPGDAQ